jgi:cell division protein FtsZ
MSLNLNIPDAQGELKPRLAVVGVGGGGTNAVDNMIRLNLEGVDFVVANTDAQTLSQSKAPLRMQLGTKRTKGLGAGARPDVGREAAEEAIVDVLEAIQGYDMVFITAGMGGGTGTGAAPVIARAAREQGILTVGVVTKPFHFEGAHRMRLAEAGIEEMQQFVDTLIIVPNQNLFRIADEQTTFMDAFRTADNVLYQGVRGITDLIMMPGMINLDFADIRTVMSEMGKAMMGTGEADGADRAIRAAEAAISNPLLDDVSMRGAKGILIHVSGALDMTLFEADQAANRIREEVDPNANIIFGATFDEKLMGKIRISVVATGIEATHRGPGAIGDTDFSGNVAPAFRRPAAAAAPIQPNFQPQMQQPSAGQSSSGASSRGYRPSAYGDFPPEQPAGQVQNPVNEQRQPDFAARQPGNQGSNQPSSQNAGSGAVSGFADRVAQTNRDGANRGGSAQSGYTPAADEGWDEIVGGQQNQGSQNQGYAEGRQFSDRSSAAPQPTAAPAASNVAPIKRGLPQVDDPFIPPAATEPRSIPSSRPSAAQTQPTAAQGHHQANPDEQSYNDDLHGRSPSLFERVTNAAFPRLGRNPAGSGQPAGVEPSFGGANDGGAAASPQGAAPNPSSGNPSKDLEIPAFLRRQGS